MRGLIQMEVNASIASFRLNAGEMAELLTGSYGPVGRDLLRRAIRVETAAKQIASSPPPSQPGHGPAVRTGRLRGSITWRLGRDELSLYADVGSNVLYAPYVEIGTSRMQARPYLRPALQMARV